MSQSPPGLKLGLVLELVMLAFEMNGKMPTDFSMRRAHLLTAAITFIQTPSFLAEFTGSGVSTCNETGTGAFVTNYLWGLHLE